MRTRLLIALAALGALLALPAIAGATMAYTTTPGKASGTNMPIKLADDDGANVRTLNVSGMEPMISPNGKYIAYTFISNTKTWTQELRFVNVATGVMLDTNLACTGPEWAPNSSAVACTVARYGTPAQGMLGTGINTVTPDGTSTIILPATGYAVQGYSWSPDSSKIVWDQTPINVKTTRSTLRWLNADGSGAVGKLGNGVNPVWGPTKIAFTRMQHVMVNGLMLFHQEIWTLDPAVGASSAEQLTDYKAKGFIEGPTPKYWTPDGTRVVGAVTGQDYNQPVYVPVSSGKVTVFGPGNAAVQGVSADGTQALVIAGLMGDTPQPVYASPLAKESSSLLLKDAWAVSATANWQP